MPQLEFGIRRGAAIRLGDSQVQDVRYHYALKQRAEAQAQKQAALFADDFDYKNAMNQHDNPIVKEYAKNQIKNIGSYLRQNPDWQTDVTKLAEYKRMVRELKDNPDLNRGMQSDSAYQEMVKFQANPKNAGIVNDPEFIGAKQGWQNYLKYGNQGGEEAAKVEGKKAFTFIPPDIFDSEAAITDVFSKLKTREDVLTRADYKGAIGMGATVSKVGKDTLDLTALSMLNNPATGYKLKNEWDNKLTDVERKYFGNVVNWISMRGEGKTEKKIDTGQYWKPETGGRGGGGYGDGLVTPFLNEIASKESGTSPDVSAISPLFSIGPNKRVYKPTAAMPLKVLYRKKDGTEGLKEIAGYENIEIESTETKAFRTIGGKKVLEIRSRIPLAGRSDLTSGDNPMFVHPPGRFFGVNESEFQTIPGYEGVANIEKNEDGESTGFANVIHYVPADINQATTSEYDKKRLGVKVATESYGVTQQVLNTNEIRRIAKQFGGTAGTFNGQPAIQKGGRIYDLNGNLLQ